MTQDRELENLLATKYHEHFSHDMTSLDVLTAAVALADQTSDVYGIYCQGYHIHIMFTDDSGIKLEFGTELPTLAIERVAGGALLMVKHEEPTNGRPH